MPFLPPPPAAEVDYAAAPQERLFDLLRDEAASRPGHALDLAPLLKNELRRDQLRRQAFLTASATDRPAALRHLASLIDKPWIEEVPLLDAIAIALDLKDATLARRLVLFAALRNPSLAVRTAADYLALPFGREIFETAALAVPGDAVLVASGNSPSAKEAHVALAAGTHPSIRFFAMLARRNDIDPALRERAAVFHEAILRGTMSLDQALALAAKPPAYFHALVEMRLANKTNARTMDRLLEAQALPMTRSVNDGKSAAQSADLRAMPARDIFLLLSYGRAEEGEAGFADVFDHVFLPKFRAERLTMLRLLESMGFLQFRPFVAAALASQRLEALLAACTEAERGRVVAAFVEGLDRSEQPLADLVSAAEIVDNLAPVNRLSDVAHAIAQAHQRAASRQTRAMYGLLAALADNKLKERSGSRQANNDASNSTALNSTASNSTASRRARSEAKPSEVSAPTAPALNRDRLGTDLRLQLETTDEHRDATHPSRDQSGPKGRVGSGFTPARYGGRDSSTQTPWKPIAANYKAALSGVDTLERAPLFPREQLCVQRHFFYNDADGVESYESFRATYDTDTSWKTEEQDGWVRLIGVNENRRIQIFANVPINLNTSEHAADSDVALRRQQRVSQALSSAKLEPTIVVHRGHSYHVDKTLDYLNSAARLVFLGSCHGMGKMDTVMERAPAAQVIATRGIGTAGINDPMLKSLNDALLRGTGDLRWPDFWQAQKNRFGSNRAFAEYVPPHKNTAADVLRAYYASLDGDEPAVSNEPQ